MGRHASFRPTLVSATEWLIKQRTDATNREKRELARCFVEGVDLDPDRRETEVRVKLPPNTVQRVEAATRVALFGTILAKYARVRLQYIAGRGARAARIVEAAT